MTAAQLVAAGLALWGTWDLAGRLIEWGEDDDTPTRWRRQRRALNDVTKGRHRDR